MKKIFPIVVVVLVAVYAGMALMAPKNAGEYDLVGLARLPVLSSGRVKPLDTVARNALLQFRGKQSVFAPNGAAVTPQEWFADVIFGSAAADGYKIFKVDHPDVQAIFGLTRSDGLNDSPVYSFDQLKKQIGELQRQYDLTKEMDDGERSAFQKAVVKVYSHLATYVGLRYSFTNPEDDRFALDLVTLDKAVPQGVEAIRAQQAKQPYDEALAKQMTDITQGFLTMQQYAEFVGLRPIPPAAAEPAAGTPAAGGDGKSQIGDGSSDWESMDEALLATFQRGRVPVTAIRYALMAQTWRERNAAQFNAAVSDYAGVLDKQLPAEVKKASLEARFNYAAPFFRGIFLYVTAFLLAVFSWLFWPEQLGRAAFWTVAVAWVLATSGILTRMWLEGRPPVTNLYSSAIFIGWGAVALCLILEAIYRNGIGSAAAGLVGFSTLVIAHYLSLSGDTLEMMRAVLDTNFWLATHVVAVTLGYASTYLAGFLAIIYILRGVFTRSLDKATADSLGRMVYGIVCFATLFSLIGTILGGIWADQSWGRFWGWDPKENGALIIVVWNAIILHARWGGMIRQRGLMCLAVAGNIVTSWSWFGVNMLSVGLHSYGFIESTFWWLIGFVISQVVLIAIANMPLARWRSAAAA